MNPSPASGAAPNRLNDEASPYLRQHAFNPVDWFPWGEEALAKAEAEDKPILLSVGYSACHWCHVMAHESFEDPVTAAQMNRDFVNIKVDREERPDVDAIYMNAVQAMTGQGGWPMTVALTPDGQPFYGGTYFPPEDRYGRPSFRRVLAGLADAWKERRGEVMASASQLTDHLRALSSVPPAEGEPSEALLGEALETLYRHFDTRHGGFGGAPKFPPHHVLDFLLRSYQRSNEARALQMAELTLERMARGGLYDHLAGGFARYSVDERWLVPHFEKMLYDNAQLVRRYLEAYQLTGSSVYQEIAEETLDWVQREMMDPAGGFYSALDADSEGEEGKFYVWSDEEIGALLGEDAALARALYGVTASGNFEGKTILHQPRDPRAVAEDFGLSEEALREKRSSIRATLLAARDARIRPGLDDKVLLSWNGLMLAAFADAGRVLERQDYTDVALANAAFVRAHMGDGARLMHVWKDGRASVLGMLEDYSFYGLGLVALYRASLDPQWLFWATELAETITARFADEDKGGFFSTADDAERLIVRPKDFFDGAVPSGNAASAELLTLLAHYLGRRDLEDLALGCLKPVLDGMREQPNGFGLMLCVAERLLAGPREIAVLGERGDAATQALLRLVQTRYLPNTVVALAEREDAPIVARLPWLQGRTRLNGAATVYVCERGVCQRPVTTPQALVSVLESH